MRDGFQSTPPRRGRPNTRREVLKLNRFQSTPPRRGRPPRPSCPLRACRYFNPRPRAGGDRADHRPCRQGSYFNPRPRAGGDCNVRHAKRSHQNFNPRPRAGGDLVPCGLLLQRLGISIHAPAQGATRDLRHGGQRFHISIHAPAQGATCVVIDNPPFSKIFQSTPPRRGRHDGLQRRRSHRHFNPRPRAGGDK